MRILITGATGNVGQEVLSFLSSLDHKHELFAGLRDIEKDRASLEAYPKIQYKAFDFDKIDQFQAYLEGMDVLFLLRPPHISNVTKFFQPLIEAASAVGLQHLVFLSVQGVEKSSIIPHHKIEKLIKASGIPYTFLRPAYFMQNFSTTLRADIIKKDKVYLPAGKANFNLIDVKDVGEVAAQVLIHPAKHKNSAYDLCIAESMDFQSMCSALSHTIGKEVSFVSPNLLSFFIQKRKEGVATPFILVMIMLHYLPRFQKPTPISDQAEKLLGRPPNSFEDFLKREKDVWIN